MRDLDSAVGRLDNILMSVYVIVAVLIIAVTLVRLLQRLSKLDLVSPILANATCYAGHRGRHFNPRSVCLCPWFSTLLLICGILIKALVGLLVEAYKKFSRALSFYLSNIRSMLVIRLSC
jgi:hypothetical protein